MLKTNIALIGFRATGKSSVGRTLAAKLRRQFVDMDERLMASFGQDIRAWVQTHGWESFRDAESDLLINLARHKNWVVATGGGIVERKANREVLKRNFFVVWLQASPETIYSRLVEDHKTCSTRPPLSKMPLEEEIEHLIRVRKPLYEEVTDLMLSSDEYSPLSLSKLISEFVTSI